MVEKESLDKIREFCKESNILCVEDDFELRNSLITLLGNFFDNIYVAEDGQEAYKLYKEYNGDFELILTDINMPNMDGVEMVTKIKELNPGQKVVVLTAYDEEEYDERFRELGVEYFLKKPAKLDSFLRIIIKLMIPTQR